MQPSLGSVSPISPERSALQSIGNALFISHAKEDNVAARELADQLRARGYEGLFLDSDIAGGIPGGVSWEYELYQQLSHCRALIFICSRNGLNSRWCFAEITQAKALGKHVIPLRFDDCPPHPLLQDRQMVDLSARTYEPLWRAMHALNLETEEVFAWDRGRCPYPGLPAFEEAQAAVFFGREQAIREGLELLNRMHHYGRPNLALIIGASGSGKSSLLRAGLVARARRNREQWIVLDPFRPRAAPWDEFAQALCTTLSKYDVPVDLSATYAGLADRGSSAVEYFSSCFERVRARTNCPDANVLIHVDQFEELLIDNHFDQRKLMSGAFLQYLRSLVSLAKVYAVATVRSDFLGTFQEHPVAHGWAFASFPLGPMSREDLVEAIEAPAEVAGARVGRRLSDRIVSEMMPKEPRQMTDALPLLAFTLERLWVDFGRDALLDVFRYESWGGLGGAIRRAAERALVDSGSKSKEQTRALRSALLRLVYLDEDKKFIRRTVAWTDLPEVAQPILERLVESRLLVSRQDGDLPRTVEFAHEAIFRAWDQLSEWLRQAQEFLIWRKRFEQLMSEWERDRRSSSRLLRGHMLREAHLWCRRELGLLTERQHDFIRRSQHGATIRLISIASGLVAILTFGFALALYLTPEQIDLVGSSNVYDYLSERTRGVLARGGSGAKAPFRLGRVGSQVHVKPIETGSKTAMELLIGGNNFGTTYDVALVAMCSFEPKDIEESLKAYSMPVHVLGLEVGRDPLEVRFGHDADPPAYCASPKCCPTGRPPGVVLRDQAPELLKECLAACGRDPRCAIYTPGPTTGTSYVYCDLMKDSCNAFGLRVQGVPEDRYVKEALHQRPPEASIKSWIATYSSQAFRFLDDGIGPAAIAILARFPQTDRMRIQSSRSFFLYTQLRRDNQDYMVERGVCSFLRALKEVGASPPSFDDVLRSGCRLASPEPITMFRLPEP